MLAFTCMGEVRISSVLSLSLRFLCGGFSVLAGLCGGYVDGNVADGPVTC